MFTQIARQVEQLECQVEIHLASIHVFQQTYPFGLLLDIGILFTQLDVRAVGANSEQDRQFSRGINAQRGGAVGLLAKELIGHLLSEIGRWQIRRDAGGDPFAVDLFGQERTKLANPHLGGEICQRDATGKARVDPCLFLFDLRLQPRLP